MTKQSSKQNSAGSVAHPVIAANGTQVLDDAKEGRFLRLAHAGLRGRYLLAMVVGVVIGAGVGAYTWFTTEPVYQSTGYIRVKAYTQAILVPSENKIPQYDNHLQAQANMIRSRRVIDDAMESEAWRVHSTDLSPQARDEFVANLSVRARPDIEQIIVGYKDVDPAVAQAATSAVIEAYDELQSSIDREGDLSRLGVLEELRASYSSQLTQLGFQIEQVDRALGAQGIAAWHSAKVSQLAEYERAVEQLNMELAALDEMKERRDQQGDTGGDLPLDPALAGVDDQNPLIPRIREQIARLEDESVLLMKRMGEGHPAILQKQDQILLLETELARLLEEDSAGVAGSGDEGEPIVDQLAQTIELKTREIDLMATQVTSTRQELESLAEKLRQIDSLRQQEAELKANLDQVRSRITLLNIEESERVEILSLGEASWQPVNASQKRSQATMRGVMGFVGGFSLVGLLGLVGKRVGRSDILQLDIGDKRLIGLMPDLTEKIEGAAASQLAQMSIDHIRSLIHLGMNHDTGTCLAITGPQSGSGKTTLSITLALSFAESGSKVLLIDLDTVGGGLSHHVKARQRTRLGELLAEVAGIDPQQIEDVASRISGGGRQLGEYLVQEGVVEQEHVDVALERQSQELGVRHALAGADFAQCTFPSRTPGLYVLPLRWGEEKQVGRVGPRAIKQLFERAREAYDTVIIDTGPAPGSVETSLATAAADATVVVVSRNDQRADVKSCTEFLESVGAKIYGFVMNRVENKDMRSSKISSSYSRMSQENVLDDPIFNTQGLNAADDSRQPADSL